MKKIEKTKPSQLAQFQISNMNLFLRVFSTAILATVLSACFNQSSIKSDIHALHDRLETFTGIEIEEPAVSDVAVIKFDKTSLQLDIPELQINLREFYALDECQLTKQIAERNTALGKVQLPSTRYFYELNLLNALRTCEQQLPEDHRMQGKLREWISAKEKTLPLTWSNFLTQGQEVYNLFNISSDLIAGNDDDAYPATLLALKSLRDINPTKVANGNFSADKVTDIEEHLRTLDKSRLIAKMKRSQNFIREALTQLNPLLDEYLMTLDCSDRQQREDLKIMRNIFSMFFAEKIQPVASELNRYHYNLYPLVEELLDTDGVNDSVKAVIRNNWQRDFDNYQTSVKQHVERWQSIFAACSTEV